MTPEQIEATRPAFEVWANKNMGPPLDRYSNSPWQYRAMSIETAWFAWQAAKADTLAHAPSPDGWIACADHLPANEAPVLVVWQGARNHSTAV